jgi:hypothetical protein
MVFLLSLVIPSQAFEIRKGAAVPAISLPNASEQIINTQVISKERVYLITFLFLNTKSSAAIINNYKNLLDKTNGKLDIYVIALDKNQDALVQYKNSHIKNLFIVQDATQQIAKNMQVLVAPMAFLVNKNNLLSNVYIDFNSAGKMNLLKDIEKELQLSLL